MKILFTSKSQGMDALLDPHFGRAKGFILYDTEKKSDKWIDNTENLNAAHGAGIQAAQRVIEQKPDVIITGSVGPKASAVLAQTDIKIYLAEEKNLSEILEEFTAGKLELL